MFEVNMGNQKNLWQLQAGKKGGLFSGFTDINSWHELSTASCLAPQWPWISPLTRQDEPCGDQSEVTSSCEIPLRRPDGALTLASHFAAQLRFCGRT